jgi:mono/diheme cytochrome c family protein
MEISMRALVVKVCFVVLVALTAIGVASAQSDKGLRKWNPDAAKVKNPVPSTPESIAAGEAIYMRRCRACHGRDGTGGNPKDTGSVAPPNLVDREWTFGSSDGEIFYVVRNGVGPAFEMEPWDDRLSETDTWNVINFLRDLAKKSPAEAK